MKTTEAPITAATALLDKVERAKLLQLEDVLDTARRWQVEEAKALLVIRDRRLYRATHSTFEEYGADRWGFERAHLYRLVAWAEVIAAVSPFGGAPERESHARPLAGLTPEQQRDVWRAVLRRHRGRHNAADVEAIVQGAPTS